MPERDGPIITLANKLTSRGVPSLSVLISLVDSAEDLAAFINLVDEYLPERRQDIFCETRPSVQIALFGNYFADRYFPLDDYVRTGDAEEYSELTYRMPVIVMGLSYDDFHEIPEYYDAGIQLMTLLVESPWDDGEESGVALAEACQEHVSQELVERAAGIKLTAKEAHKLLDSTKYEQLAHWADRLHYCTENFFLDTDYEDLMNSVLEWDRVTVEDLTTQWHRADAAENELYKFVTWLEADTAARFEQMVNFILERRASG